MRLGRLGVAVGTGMVVLGALLWVTAATGARAQQEADQQQQQARRTSSAKGLRGGAGTRAGTQVEGHRSRADADRASLIELRFAEDERLSGLGLDAQVGGGSIKLTGTVKSDEDRARAEQLATTAPASDSATAAADRELPVDNQIAVEPPAPPKSAKEERAANDPMTMEERERLRRERVQAALRRQEATEAISTETAPASELGAPSPASASPPAPPAAPTQAPAATPPPAALPGLPNSANSRALAPPPPAAGDL